MKQIQIGKSDIKNASAVALGVMRMDSKTEKEAAEIVTTASEAGINFFDTADIYGAGKSSRVFGQAIKDAGLKRENIYIQSKGGILLGDGQIDGDGEKGPGFDFSKSHLVAAAEIEIERLGVDYLDTFLLHRPDTLMEVDEIAEAFDDLSSRGLVKNFGVSNFTPFQIQYVQKAINQRLEINQLQFGLTHTLMIDETIRMNITDDKWGVDRSFDSLTFSQLNDITIQAWSPFQYGFFDGVFIDSPKYPELNAKLEELAKKYGVTKNGIAVAWIFRHPAKIQTVIGSMTPERIKEMTDIDNVQLTKQEWYGLYEAAGMQLP
jgi:predicted oxidoreductase